MREGWLGDDYLILFDESQIALISDRYGISDLLLGYRVVGLHGWDDFILADNSGRTFLTPTIPIDREHFSPFSIPNDTEKLVSDPRFKGKIKWYLTPLVFGGDPKTGDNLTWVSHEEHAELVRWWNANDRDLRAQPLVP